MLTRGPSGKADTQIEVPAGLEPLLRLDGVACFRTCTLAKEYMVPYRFCARVLRTPVLAASIFDFDTGDCIHVGRQVLHPAHSRHLNRMTAIDAALEPEHADAAAAPLAPDSCGLIRIALQTCLLARGICVPVPGP